jgi:hypothetical protein
VPIGVSRRFSSALAGITGIALVIRFLQLVARPTCAEPIGPNTDGTCFGVWGDALYGHWQGELIAAGQWFKDPVAFFIQGGEIREAAGKPPLYPMAIGAMAWVGDPDRPFWQWLAVAAAVVAIVVWAARRFLTPVIGSIFVTSAVVALGGLLVFDGSSPTVQRVILSIIGALTVTVIGLTAAEIRNERAGLIAAGLAAVHPLLWINDAMLQVESIYGLLIALTLLMAYRWWRDPTVAGLVALSVALAAGAMFRAEGQFLVPVMMVPLAFRAKGLDVGRRLGAIVVAGAIALLMWTPWILWNQQRFEMAPFGAMTTGSGAVLVSAYCDETFYGEALGYWAAHCFEQPIPGVVEPDESVERAVNRVLRVDGLADRLIQSGNVVVAADSEAFEITLDKNVLDDSEVDAVARAKALDYASDNIGRMAVVVPARILRTYDLYRPLDTLRINWQVEGRGRWSSAAGLLVHWVLMPFAVAGAVILWRRRVTLVPIAATIVVVVFTTALTFGVTRYRLPSDICEILLAAVAIDTLIFKMTTKSEQEVTHESIAAN